MIDTLTCIELKSLLSEVTISYLEYANVCVESKTCPQRVEAAYSRAYTAKQRMLSYINKLEGAGNE